MRRQILIGVLCASALLMVGWQKPQNDAERLARIAWVGDSLREMRTIKPGMTRAELLKVFRTEGGIFTGLKRTYVYRDCPYFKIDVEFKPAGRPGRDQEGGVTLEERNEDIIKTISRKYVQWSVMD